ncbi:MAG: ResB protein required for cytochrome C biosynthesis [Puniceicoccaceae bacterium]|nr:MAG: ResB protein required for cytochrome C biosynthesis [Puniceicoccaceae bacterium]
MHALRILLRLFSSLQLTIACLIAAMVLVFVGTIDQVNLGIHAAQAKYFHSFVVWWEFPESHLRLPVFPGGFLLGGVLIVNLLAAHFTRFKLSAGKSGIVLIHLGIILLLVGELVTGLFQVESQLRLSEGETKRFSESWRSVELVLIDRSDPEVDRVWRIDEAALIGGGTFRQPDFPVDIVVRRFLPNSRVFRRPPGELPPEAVTAGRGLGRNLFATELPRTGKIDERDISTAEVELVTPEGSLGTWMACNAFDEVQPIEIDGRTFHLEMRQRRYYKPFSLHLLEFTHDRYPGTDIPANFSSRVRLHNPATREDRSILIYMNHPLRYDGLTFYQAGYDDDDTTSILQVVRNPGRHLPYIASSLVTLGLVVQFLMHFHRFGKRRRAGK